MIIHLPLITKWIVKLDGDNYMNHPYNVYDYDDPEEFYYGNYDDFDGYEDAETYWDDAWW